MLNIVKYLKPVLQKIKKSAKFRSFFGLCLWKNSIDSQNILLSDHLYLDKLIELLKNTEFYEKTQLEFEQARQAIHLQKLNQDVKILTTITER